MLGVIGGIISHIKDAVERLAQRQVIFCNHADIAWCSVEILPFALTRGNFSQDTT